MNQQQTQKYNALASCQATANQYSTAWTGYPPFSEPWGNVLSYKVVLDGLIADQTTPFTAAGQKAIYRNTLKTAMIKAVTALEWLAGSTQDAALRKLAHLTSKDIDHATEAELVGLATKRSELVAAHAAAILPVGYTAADATALQIAITQFSEAIGQPGAEHDTHEEVTGQIEDTIDQIYTLLATQCDPAVAARADSHPDFATQWELSREIGHSPARRTRALEVHVQDAAHHPLAGAEASITDGSPTPPIRKRSAAAGSFYIQNMAPGNYTMKVERPGYVTQVVPVAIVEGQLAVVTVTLGLL